MDFISYAFKDLSLKQVKKYAEQYHGYNMWQIIGQDESRFPLVVMENDSWPAVYFWSRHSGLMKEVFEDQVLEYAFGDWLIEHAHPIFPSIEAALNHAFERQWPGSSDDT